MAFPDLPRPSLHGPLTRSPAVAPVAAVLLLLCAQAACVRRAPPPPPVQLEAEHVEPELITVRHKVEPGQTLYRIARAYGLTAVELMEANGIEDPRSLAVGQELIIPGATEPVAIAPAEPGAQIPPPPSRGSEEDPDEPTPEEPPPGPARSRPVKPPPPHKAQRPAATAARSVERPAEKKGALRWPLRGVLYARFGKKGKELHDGIDLAAPEGTPVATSAEGTVLFAGEQKGYGLIAIVEHEGGLITLYAHNRDLRVKTGQRVREGQVIATVGESGHTSGPHLHFEVRKEGVPVDPLQLLGPVPPR